ncbi:MAG: efflux RND transporter periplasmic adaptor subunit [Calditrichaeota bacterium]|nr:efflux RND transporter periplasmic adaptor subunit [Calditrichota bacterium]
MKQHIIFFGLIIFFVFGCGNKNAEQSSHRDALVKIKTAAVMRTDMVDTERIFGEIRLRYEAYLASQFDGRLEDFTLLPGDVVKKEERIGTIIPPSREALLQIINKISAEMKPLLEQQIKSIPLTSPMNGTVLKILHHSGDVVHSGEPIVHIGDTRILDVYGDLPIRYIPLIKKLQKIEIQFTNYPHSPMRLPIQAISAQVDQAKQTVPIRLRLDNPNGEFRPGMLVQLIFPGQEHKNTLIVPRSALLEEEGIFSVFVVKGKKVEKRLVKVGIFNNDNVEIINGVQAGEQVATQKAYSLVDGMEVVVE